MHFKAAAPTLLATALVLSATPLASSPARAGDAGAAAVGAIFGLAAGTMIGASAGPGYYYRPAPAYVAYYGPRVHRVCELRQRVNRWGEVVGTRRVCWNEQY